MTYAPYMTIHLYDHHTYTLYTQMPSRPDLASFRQIVTGLPDNDAPYVFCLPDNIERSLQRNNSAAVIRQLLTLSSIDVEGSKFDREKWRAQIGPILDLWQQMLSTAPGVLQKSAYGAKAGGSKETSKDTKPVDDFVEMENTFAGGLCNTVDASLAALKKVLFGSGLLTPVIQQVAISLLAGEVPTSWTGKWDYGPQKPQAWLTELVRKRLALTKWSGACAKGTLLQVSDYLVLEMPISLDGWGMIEH